MMIQCLINSLTPASYAACQATQSSGISEAVPAPMTGSMREYYIRGAMPGI